MKISIDFETFSECELKKAGAWRYAQDKSTEVLCLAYSVDGAPPKLWLPGDPFPTEFEYATAIYAWNAAFEIAIWHHVCTRLYGWPPVPLRKFIDSMAIAASFAFPMKLGEAAEALGAEVKKDTRGTRLLNKFSKPQKATKRLPERRIRPEDAPDDFRDLCAYCKTDVRTEQAVLARLPRTELSEFEQRIWLLDLENNMRGIRVDLPAVHHILALVEEHENALELECERITGGARSSQRAEVMPFAARIGYPLNGYTVADVDSALEDPALPGPLRRVLEIRQSLGKTSVKKYVTIAACAGLGDRIRGMTVFHGANTGRFAGRLVQLQNLPRGNLKKAHTLAPFVTKLTLEDFEMLCGDPMEAFSSMIRSMLIPSVGHQLYVADYANIEGRVLAWMAGQDDLVRRFAAGDDIYKHMAAAIYNVRYEDVTDDQRQVGKQAILGCGYGMGWKKFIVTCWDKAGIVIGDELAMTTVTAYREVNDKIPAMWNAVGNAAMKAIKAPGRIFTANMCKFAVQGDFLLIKLPSGRCLAYYKPLLRKKTLEWGVVDEITFMGKDGFTNRWARVSTYGAKLVENIVQAVARDLLVYGMIATTEAGYVGLTTVHDELVSEAPIGFGSVHEFEELMASLPTWAQGCPVKSEGWSGPRYRK